ncbi:protein LLP homolog isoform X1 [Parasteatoda tepidariorum]|uniref:protein LLP homolog isoform X1 n=1 Tax=Parasteatoda tepidariorum TaxID=114398 RepID=UPI001C729672|nr:protein LLP homolog [Parasteatoda tepidariorum]
MAKSLRSKWKRKMKAVKRVRYGEKELKRLKSILPNPVAIDVNMSDICTVLPKGALSKNSKPLKDEEGCSQTNKTRSILKKKEISFLKEKQRIAKENNEDEKCSANESMEIDESKRKYHPKKMIDENGNYPIWMNRRAIKKLKEKNRRLNQKTKKNKKKHV